MKRKLIVTKQSFLIVLLLMLISLMFYACYELRVIHERVTCDDSHCVMIEIVKSYKGG